MGTKVDMRRFDVAAAVAQVGVPQVVEHDEDDIGFVRNRTGAIKSEETATRPIISKSEANFTRVGIVSS